MDLSERPDAREHGEGPLHALRSGDSGPVRITAREHNHGLVVEALDRQGANHGVVEAERRDDGSLLVRRFEVREGPGADDIATQLLGAAGSHADELRFRWRRAGTGAQQYGRVELLREGDRVDRFWRERTSVAGPSAAEAADRDAAHHLAVDATSRQIRDHLGVGSADLAPRTAFLSDPDFDRRAADLGVPAADVPHVLGLYDPSERRLLVRDGDESLRQGVLLHESLHAASHEARERPVPPALDEAMTQYFTTRIDPTAGRLTGIERTSSGGVRLLVPGLEAPRRSGDVESVPAPEVYPEGLVAVRQLASHVGEEPLRELYVTGDDRAVAGALDRSLGRGSWARFRDAVGSAGYEDADWSAASRVLTGR